MREYELEIYDAAGAVLAREAVRVTEQPGRTVLHRLARRQVLQRKEAAAAALWLDGKVQGLFVTEEVLPQRAVGTSGNPLERGTWFTATARLGTAVRGLIGPDAFARQVDFKKAWVAPLLMRFEPRAEVREHRLGDTIVYDIAHAGARFFYASVRGRWTLYGAGSVTDEAVDHVVANGAASADDLVWALGAIKLG